LRRNTNLILRSLRAGVSKDDPENAGDASCPDKVRDLETAKWPPQDEAHVEFVRLSMRFKP
jgi:hypothetical protein